MSKLHLYLQVGMSTALIVLLVAMMLGLGNVLPRLTFPLMISAYFIVNAVYDNNFEHRVRLITGRPRSRYWWVILAIQLTLVAILLSLTWFIL